MAISTAGVRPVRDLTILVAAGSVPLPLVPTPSPACAVLRAKQKAWPALGWWLVVVGAVRLAFTWSCFFGSAALCSATYSGTQMTGVHGRTVGVWTLLSCTLCFLCAFNLHNKALRMATLLSFVYAYGYFVVEYLVHNTVPASSLAALGFFAVPSIVWMLLDQWNSHGHGLRTAAKQP